MVVKCIKSVKNRNLLENATICIQYAFISRSKVRIFCNVVKSKDLSDVETTVPICEIQKEKIIVQDVFIATRYVLLSTTLHFRVVGPPLKILFTLVNYPTATDRSPSL